MFGTCGRAAHTFSWGPGGLQAPSASSVIYSSPALQSSAHDSPHRPHCANSPPVTCRPVLPFSLVSERAASGQRKLGHIFVPRAAESRPWRPTSSALRETETECRRRVAWHIVASMRDTEGRAGPTAPSRSSARQSACCQRTACPPVSVQPLHAHGKGGLARGRVGGASTAACQHPPPTILASTASGIERQPAGWDGTQDDIEDTTYRVENY